MQSDSLSPRKAARIGRKGSVPGQLPPIGSASLHKMEGKTRPKSLAFKMLLAVILCIALFVISTVVSSVQLV
jgi:hypothetical protein